MHYFFSRKKGKEMVNSIQNKYIFISKTVYVPFQPFVDIGRCNLPVFMLRTKCVKIPEKGSNLNSFPYVFVVLCPSETSSICHSVKRALQKQKPCYQETTLDTRHKRIKQWSLCSHDHSTNSIRVYTIRYPLWHSYNLSADFITCRVRKNVTPSNAI